MLYQFLDFHLDSEQRSLYRQHEEVAISNKIYQFLLLMVENAGQTVSRSRIDKAVWGSRVVTDATLYKTVARARTALNDDDEANPIIQTVHGEGYRFIPQVQVEPALQPEVDQAIGRKPRQQWRWQWVAVSAVILGLLGFWYDRANQPDPSQYALSQLNVSLIPSRLGVFDALTGDQPHDWLLEGGLFYLAELFLTHDGLHVTRPSRRWLEAENKDQLAIDLIDKDQTDVAVLAELAKVGELFKSQVILRGDDGVFAEKQFESASMRQLMTQISDWVSGYLIAQPVNQPNGNRDDELSQDEFALESYIRGMTAQLKGDYAKAQTFFEAAVQQDNEFLIAWYELGIAKRRLGHYREAISIFTTLSQRSQRLQGRLANATGIAYWRLGEYDNARAAYQAGLQYAPESSDTKSALLINIAILSLELGDLTIASDSLTQVVQRIDPGSDQLMLGRAMNTFARLERQRGDIQRAVDYSNKAIDAFKKGGHRPSENAAKSRLSGLLLRLGEFSRAEALAKETLAFREQSNDRSGMIGSAWKLAEITTETGRFEKSIDYWKMVLDLNLELTDLREQAEIYANLTNLHLRRNDAAKASEYLVLHTDLIRSLNSDRMNKVNQILQLRLLLATEDIDAADDYISELGSLNDAEIQIYLGDLSQLKGDLQQAETAYLNAIELQQDRASVPRKVELYNRLIGVYMQTDESQVETYLRRVLQYPSLPYPALKYQAALEYRKGNSVRAASLMHQLKQTANDFWISEDQLLLEKYSKAD